MTTCKICNFKEVRYQGEICPKCLVAFQSGEQAGKNHVVKELRQELQSIIRKLESMILY